MWRDGWVGQNLRRDIMAAISGSSTEGGIGMRF